jgi:hypothetical protein
MARDPEREQTEPSEQQEPATNPTPQEELSDVQLEQAAGGKYLDKASPGLM